MFTTILATIAAFMIVILLLTALLLYAKAKLIPQGDLNLVVNGDQEKPMIIAPGGTLLTALGDKGVYLPSACGGGGTCSLCKCQVLSGGGDILPTEMNYMTRKEAQDNWRLACQVKVRQDMEIKVPEEIFGIQKWECEVASNGGVATFIKELILKLPKRKNLDFESGGYIQLDVPAGTYNFTDMEIEEEYREDWDKFKLWDLKTPVDESIFRAYSMANHPAEGNTIKLNIRIATPPWDRKKNDWQAVTPGLCSSYTFTLKKGDKVTISGPFGEFFIKDTKKEMVYIGGGAGMAPLRSHIYHLFRTLKTKRKVTYFYGGRSLRELFYTEDFRAIEKDFKNFKYHVALSEPLPEDNWDGATGFIHQAALDLYLKDHPEPEELEYYLCGPPQMLDAIMDMLDNLGVPEENIAFDEF